MNSAAGPESAGARLVTFLMAGVICLICIRTVRVYLNVDDVASHVRGLSYESFFKVRGLVPAADYVQASGVREVFTVPQGDDEYLFERLSELSYPVIVKPYGSARVPDGATVVWPKSKPFPGTGSTLVEFGDLAVIRCGK